MIGYLINPFRLIGTGFNILWIAVVLGLLGVYFGVLTPEAAVAMVKTVALALWWVAEHIGRFLVAVVSSASQSGA